MKTETRLFCHNGGCTAKLGAGILERVLAKIPKGPADSALLVGYESSDDAAVYQVSDDLAVVQTLDFFPPMVDDPHLFGEIAAANALSDIYAMGGEVKTALNILCFPENEDLNTLGEILRGGSEKVAEAGGVLAGGHSIADREIRYGLSVMGFVNPQNLWTNNRAQPGDLLVLTKKLGTGLLCSASRVGEASPKDLQEAFQSMRSLNRQACETAKGRTVHACTDVTGFGFLGHLCEMTDRRLSCTIWADQLPILPGAIKAAEGFLMTAAAQKNRLHTQGRVCFSPDVPFSLQEVMFDPQTSGGLLLALPPRQAESLAGDLQCARIPARIVGRVQERSGHAEISVIMSKE